MKKVIMGLAAALLVVALAVPAFAATLSDTKKKEINDLYDQIANLRKQVVQKYVDAGVLTKDQGAQMEKNIDNATKYQKDNSSNPGATGGYGCGGGGSAGYGMMGGYYNGTTNGGQGAVNTSVGQSI